jgi:hypothetical protein
MAGGFRVHKKVINVETGSKLLCCWEDCEDYGYDLYRAQVNYASEGAAPYIVKFVFCSETHKMYWVRSNQPRSGNMDRYMHGQLASGDRRRY